MWQAIAILQVTKPAFYQIAVRKLRYSHPSFILWMRFNLASNLALVEASMFANNLTGLGPGFGSQHVGLLYSGQQVVRLTAFCMPCIGPYSRALLLVQAFSSPQTAKPRRAKIHYPIPLSSGRFPNLR
ncbi:MAG: hypothetical protein CL912_33265 [Deltaproteobacteria bacterium]|nr:hypothetical protein [Deltaproteobacteria bacterium]